MKRKLALALLSAVCASAGNAETTLACKYPTLPTVVFHYSEAARLPSTAMIGGRPEVPVAPATKTGEKHTASVDGYDFAFLPTDQSLDVSKGGKLLAHETGVCVSFGSATSDTPLVIAEIAPPLPAESVTAGTGDWVVTTDTSQMDDSESVFLWLDSQESIPGRFGGPGKAKLLLRCKESKTNVLLTVNEHFLASIQGYGTVTYRIDDRKAAKVNMQESTDNMALGLWDGSAPTSFIKLLMTGQTIVFRVTPFNESPLEFTMHLAGLEEALKPLRAACKW